jgi:hypothetical protein
LKLLVDSIPSDHRNQVVNMQTLDGETALHCAAREDQLDSAEVMLLITILKVAVSRQKWCFIRNY